MAYDRFAEVHRAKAPWDIGKPQRAFVEAADQITGTVIDLGCGTGEHALFFSQRGQPVTGIDFVPEAIARTKTKASERGLDATFLVQDALALEARSTTMGAVLVFEAPYRIAITSEEDRPLGAHEVRLRTLFSGISAGTELTAYRGSNPYLHKRWDKQRRLFVADDQE